jgi:hypothetical protein
MGAITAGLGFLFLIIGVLSLRRGRIYAGGRLTRSKIAGKNVRFIAIPQAVVGGLVALVGLADMVGYSALGQYSSQGIVVLVATYFVTNLGIGGYLQARAGIEELRKPEGE